jgi:hypothetical protein
LKGKAWGLGDMGTRRHGDKETWGRGDKLFET